MDWLRRSVLIAAVVWLPAGAVSAQSGPRPSERAPAEPTVGLPRFDVSATIGWFNQKTADSGCCNWYNESLWTGIGAGYYWNEHVKTELGVAATSEGRTYSSGDDITSGGQPGYRWSDTRVRTRRVTIVQVYQFRHNAWAHPFVGAGLDVVSERRHEERHLVPSPPYDRYPPPPEQVEVVAATDTVLRGIAVAGVKGYLTQRAFLRADVQAGFRSGLDDVVLRFGGGVDF